MIEELEENSNKSLADNEIASLMKTLASKKYKENNSFPKKIISLLFLKCVFHSDILCCNSSKSS